MWKAINQKAKAKHQAHKTMDLAMLTKRKKHSSLITVCCNIQFLHHFRNFFRVRQGLRNERHSCPRENENKILLKMLIYKLLILP